MAGSEGPADVIHHTLSKRGLRKPNQPLFHILHFSCILENISFSVPFKIEGMFASCFRSKQSFLVIIG